MKKMVLGKDFLQKFILKKVHGRLNATRAFGKNSHFKILCYSTVLSHGKMQKNLWVFFSWGQLLVTF